MLHYRCNAVVFSSTCATESRCWSSRIAPRTAVNCWRLYPTRRPSTSSGPFAALDALRFCSRSVPSIVLVHAGLLDILAAEFCLLLEGRAKDRAYSALLFGATRKGPPTASPSDIAPADGYISQADLPGLAARLRALAAQNAIDDDPPVREYRGRHLEARPTGSIFWSTQSESTWRVESSPCWSSFGD